MSYNSYDSSGSYALASAAINAAASIGTTYMGISSAEKISQTDRDFSLYQQMINNAYNTSERQAAQQFSMDMWNLANEYNSPSAQLARAMEAGINPNAVIAGMSGVSSASPVTSTGQSGSTSNYSSGLGSSVLSAYQQLGAQLGGSALLAAQTRKTNAEANKTDMEASGQALKNAWDNATFEVRVKQEEERTNELIAKISDIKFTQDQTRAMNVWKARLSSAKIAEIEQNTNVLRNDVLLRAEQIVTERLRQKNIDADTLNVLQDTKNKEVENEILQVKREVEREIYAQEWVRTQFSLATNIPIGAPEWQVMYTLWQKGLFSEAVNVSAFTADNEIDVVRTGALLASASKREIESNFKKILREGEKMLGRFNREPSIKAAGGLKQIFVESLIQSIINEFK